MLFISKFLIKNYSKQLHFFLFINRLTSCKRLTRGTTDDTTLSALVHVRNFIVHPGRYTSVGPGSYKSGRLVRLIHCRDRTSGKQHISMLRIVLVGYRSTNRDSTAGEQHISSLRIVHVGFPMAVGIVHPGCSVCYCWLLGLWAVGAARLEDVGKVSPASRQSRGLIFVSRPLERYLCICHS